MNAISPSDPLVVIAGIRQFGLAPDGSDLRELGAAIARLRAENERLKARLQPDPEGPPVDQECEHLAEQCAELLRENERLKAELAIFHRCREKIDCLARTERGKDA